MGLCSTCNHRKNAYVSSYSGCDLLLLEKTEGSLRGTGITESEILNTIQEADVIGLGWIKTGFGIVNNQIIVQNVKTCKKYTQQTKIRCIKRR